MIITSPTINQCVSQRTGLVWQRGGRKGEFLKRITIITIIIIITLTFQEFHFRSRWNVHWIHYEDLIEDLYGCIEKIAYFGNFDANEHTFKRVEARAKPEYMKAHSSKFDDHSMYYRLRYILDEIIINIITTIIIVIIITITLHFLSALCHVSPSEMPLPLHKDIDVGNSEDRSNMISKAIRDDMVQMWKNIVKPVTNCDDYSELRALVKTDTTSGHWLYSCDIILFKLICFFGRFRHSAQIRIFKALGLSLIIISLPSILWSVICYWSNKILYLIVRFSNPNTTKHLQ